MKVKKLFALAVLAMLGINVLVANEPHVHRFAADDEAHSVCLDCGHGFFHYSAYSIVVPDYNQLYDAENKPITIISNTLEGRAGTIELEKALVTIGRDAFKNRVGLVHGLTIPNTVKTISVGAFSGCTGLTDIISIPKTVEHIGAEAFANCNQITGVEVDWETPLTISRSSVFKDCDLSTKTLYVPSTKRFAYANDDSWYEFGEFLMKSCKEHHFEEGDETHAYCADCDHSFFRYQANDVVAPHDASQLRGDAGSLKIKSNTCQNGEGVIEMYGKLTQLGEKAFYQCTGLTGALSIPNSVLSIGTQAFAECSEITTLNLGNKLITIGTSSFSYCTGLKGPLTIPNSVTTISTCAFDGCGNLSGTLTIPSSVESIGTYAFRLCTNLSTVAVDWDEPLSINPNVFDYWGNLSKKTLKVDCRKGRAYYTANVWKNFSITGHTFADDDEEHSECLICHHGFFRYNATAAVTPNAPENLKDANGAKLTIIANEKDTHDSQYSALYAIEFDKPLAEIGENAFKDKIFSSGITIPNTVVKIGARAFSGCTIPGGIDVGKNTEFIGLMAFIECKNVNGVLKLNNKLKNIVDASFRGLAGLKMENEELIIPGTVVSIGQGAFWGCTGLEGNLVLSEGIKYIAGYAFEGCTGIKKITIPKSVTGIYTNAFKGMTGLETIAVSWENPISISDNVFADVDLSKVALSLPCSISTPYHFANVWRTFGTIPNHTFTYGDRTCSECHHGFFHYHADEVVEPTENAQFFDGNNNKLSILYNLCDGETKNGLIEFSGIVHTIGERAFYQRTGLKGDLTLVVNRIGKEAFYGCTGLTGNLTFRNNSVQYSGALTIGESAFSNCGFTGALVCGTENYWQRTVIGKNAFKNCKFTGTLTIPNPTPSGSEWYRTTIEEGAFEGCDAFTGELSFPAAVNRIGARAFAGCTGFSSLKMNPSVEYIGSHAFDGCTELKGTLALNSAKEIGDYAFNNCSGFTGNLVIPATVTTLGKGAFQGCVGFDGTLTIKPIDLTSISDYAFKGCKKFAGTLTIPNSVKHIGSHAFAECGDYFASPTTGFDKIILSESLETIGDSAFYDCRNLLEAPILPESLKTIGNGAFSLWTKVSADSWRIPDGVESIGDYAFRGFAVVRSAGDLTVGKSVQHVGVHAFLASEFSKITFKSLPKFSNDACPLAYYDFEDDSYIYTGEDQHLTTPAGAPTYTRLMSNEWETIVLPFNVAANGEDYNLYAFTSVDNEYNMIKLTMLNGTVAAGTPVLIHLTPASLLGRSDGYELKLTATNTDLSANIKTPTEIGGLALTGTYGEIDLMGNDGYVVTNNDAYKISTVSDPLCKPFRAYFAGVATGSPDVLSLDSPDIPTGIEEIKAITEEGAEYYDINGRRIPTLQQGVNIVKFKNGKTQKVLVQ